MLFESQGTQRAASTRGGSSWADTSGVHSIAISADPGLLARACLAYTAMFVLLGTFAPFQFSSDIITRIGSGSLVVQQRDLIVNLCLLLPLGFLYRLWADRPSQRGLDALLLGIAVGLSIEVSQQFLPGRSPSFQDVVCNAAGAWAGAGICQLLRPWFTRHLAAHRLGGSARIHALLLLSLTIGLSAVIARNSARAGLCLPLGIAGAIIVASLWRGARGGPGRLSLPQLSLLAAGWMALCMLPLFKRAPVTVGVLALLVGIVTLVAARRAQMVPRSDAELPVLQAVLALMLLFVLGTAMWPSLVRPAAAHLFTLSDARPHPALVLEHFTALSLVGYLAAASVGRRLRAGAAPALAAVVATALTICLFQAGRGVALQSVAGPAVVAIGVLGGLAGGMLRCAEQRALPSVHTAVERSAAVA